MGLQSPFHPARPVRGDASGEMLLERHPDPAGAGASHTTSPGGPQQGEQPPRCPPWAGSTGTAPHRPRHYQPGAGGAQIQPLQELVALDGPSWDPKRLLGAAPDLVASSGGTLLATQHAQPRGDVFCWLCTQSSRLGCPGVGVDASGDTTETVKDLSNHGTAASSALQALGEEPLSPG